MKVLISGSRTYKPVYARAVKRVIREIKEWNGSVIVGDCTGVDKLVRDECTKQGVPCEIFEALWDVHGRAAGPIRNQAMVNERPNVCITIHDDYQNSLGTKDCGQKAFKAGIRLCLLPRESEFTFWDYDELKRFRPTSSEKLVPS